MNLRTDPLYRQILETWLQIGRRLEADGGADDDDFAWVHGGMLLFTLLRVLLRDPRAATEVVRVEIETTLSELRGRVNGAATQGVAPPAEAELGFLSAFNDYLMTRHDERLRLTSDGGLELAHLELGDRLRIAVTIAEGRGLR